MQKELFAEEEIAVYTDGGCHGNLRPLARTTEFANANSHNQIAVYTDGGCHGNPGVGAWACVIIDGENEKKLSGGEAHTTNNRMELSAAINALSAISENSNWHNSQIKIFSDSQYVKNGITSWIKNWKKNGWKTAAKKPVLNQDLWQKLDALCASLNLEWTWVKGHAGNKYNEMCDALCQEEMKKLE